MAYHPPPNPQNQQGFGYGYAPPPPQSYVVPPPSRQDYYGAPQPGPPVQHYPQQQQLGYYAPPPQSGHPQHGYAPPPPTYGGYAPPPPQHGYPQQGYPPPPHQQNYGAHVPPVSYGAPQHPPINVTADVHAIHKACRGFGTDEKALIKVFAFRDERTIDAIRHGYTHGDLIKLLQSECSGEFRTVLVATALGSVESHAFFAHHAITGAGTNEIMLTEAIMGRSTTEISRMKSAYNARWHKQLDADVRGDLSFKTEEMFIMALSGRAEEWVAVGPPHQVQAEAAALYQATRGRLGTDESTVSNILTRLNDQQLRAVAYEFRRLHGSDLITVIKKEFSGHMMKALVYILEGGLDKAQRDAHLLEESMKGFGTKDDLLIQRVVRIHWDRVHLENVKNAYKKLYGRDLHNRIQGETGGNYRQMLLDLIK